MNKSQILPGYKVELENGNVFVVREYKNTKIVFPEGSDRSAISLDELCDEELNPREHISRIIRIFDSINTPIWECVLTRNNIKPGFTMINEEGNHYLVVECGGTLRIMSTDYFLVGARLCDIMNEDMSPASLNNAAIVKIRDVEGKIVYMK